MSFSNMCESILCTYENFMNTIVVKPFGTIFEYILCMASAILQQSNDVRSVISDDANPYTLLYLYNLQIHTYY